MTVQKLPFLYFIDSLINFFFYYFPAVETLPTFQGKRLLVSGVWGKLRNPNYTGDLICNLILALPLIWNFAWSPVVCVLYMTIVLIHRAARVNSRNLARYNSAWTRYCTRVKYQLVPFIY